MAEEGAYAVGQFLTQNMLEPARVFIRRGIRKIEDIGEKPLGEPVPSHDVFRDGRSFFSKFDFVTRDNDKSLALQRRYKLFHILIVGVLFEALKRTIALFVQLPEQL
jgi:hypothetical protein